MLYEIGEIIAVKKDSLIVVKGEIVAFREDKNHLVLHPVHDSKNYLAARVIEDKKEVDVLDSGKKSVMFSDVYMVSYDT